MKLEIRKDLTPQPSMASEVRKLEVGDCLVVTEFRVRQTVHTSAGEVARRCGFKLNIRTVSDKEVRIWRVK